jgi:hypothetical protein
MKRHPFMERLLSTTNPCSKARSALRPWLKETKRNRESQRLGATTNDGAVVGEHWVTILNVGEDLPDGVPEFARVTLPERVTVVSGKDNEIDIKPSRDIVRKYREDDT